MIAIGVYSLNLVAFVLMLWRSRWEDRAAMALFALAVVLQIVWGEWTVGTWKMGLALINAGLLLGVWALAERGNRWWLIGAASIQLVIVSTHLAPFLADGLLVWSGAVARNALYFLMSVLFFVGAWEVWADGEHRRRSTAA